MADRPLSTPEKEAPFGALDPALKEYANTARQAEYVDLVNEHGSAYRAAKVAGVAPQIINRVINKLKTRMGKAQRQEAIKPKGTPGFVARELTTAYGQDGEIKGEFLREGPEPIFQPGGEDEGDARDGGGSYVIKGLSTLFDSTGQQRQQWVKTKLDDQAYLEALRQATLEFVKGVGPITPHLGPTDYDTDVIPWIQIGDAHIGMLAHEAETGANFDLKIGEQELCAAIALVIDEMVTTHERIVVHDLGDMTHYENFAGTTEASGHALDFDVRFPRMIKTYVRIMRFIVEKALEKARHVDVIVNQGNHSRTNDIWMAELLRAAYGHTGRVHVLNNDSVFIGYRMGATFVMTHHSDKCKPARLADVMATDFSEHWGEAEYRYIDIGHIHHNMVLKEHPGVHIESFNILAAPDKWAHDAGYRSRQSMTVIKRSRTYGEVGRRLLPIKQVRDAIAKAHGSAAVYRPRGKEVFVV
jgi:hypothetical protein